MTHVKKRRKPVSSRIFDIVVYILLFLVAMVTIVPFLQVVTISLSPPEVVASYGLHLIPTKIDLEGYRSIFKYKLLWTSYRNTIVRTLFGTALSMFLYVIAAYPLSRYTFSGRKFLNFFIAFTMYFGGGMIPFYLLMVKLGLYNTRWVMVIPSLISTWNIMLCRSAFTEMPNELVESAQIDGASDWLILRRIAIPLIKPTLAVVTMYYAIGHWNDFMTPLIYINKESLQPMQLLLRRILAQFSTDFTQGMNIMAALKSVVSVQIRYVTIVVAIAPILLVYPFIQKYFVKGVMLGAVKG